MTEKEKMLSGQLYDPADKELTELRLKARKLARKYNNTDEDQMQERQALLSELVPNRGTGTTFLAPIHFDYGCFISLGEECSANWNLKPLKSLTVTTHYMVDTKLLQKLRNERVIPVCSFYPFI